MLNISVCMVQSALDSPQPASLYAQKINIMKSSWGCNDFMNQHSACAPQINYCNPHCHCLNVNTQLYASVLGPIQG